MSYALRYDWCVSQTPTVDVLIITALRSNLDALGSVTAGVSKPWAEVVSEAPALVKHLPHPCRAGTIATSRRVAAVASAMITSNP